MYIDHLLYTYFDYLQSPKDGQAVPSLSKSIAARVFIPLSQHPSILLPLLHLLALHSSFLAVVRFAVLFFFAAHYHFPIRFLCVLSFMLQLGRTSAVGRWDAGVRVLDYLSTLKELQITMNKIHH
jgi:hypothetical protein